MEKKHKHLELLHDIISRLSNHSFLLKGWCVTIVAAIIAFGTKEIDMKTTLISFVPILVFWNLDSRFLLKERKYRSLFEHVRKLPETEIDYSMNTRKFKGGKNTVLKCLFSETIGIFYISLILSLILIFIL